MAINTRITSNDVLGVPFSFLNRDGLVACTQVCRRFRPLAETVLWKQIRQNCLPSTPIDPVETLRARCTARFEGIQANLMRGEFRRSDTPLAYRECNYYSA